MSIHASQAYSGTDLLSLSFDEVDDEAQQVVDLWVGRALVHHAQREGAVQREEIKLLLLQLNTYSHLFYRNTISRHF